MSMRISGNLARGFRMNPLTAASPDLISDRDRQLHRPP
jgi:hypothetical protein